MKITANQLTLLRVALLPLPYFLIYGSTYSRVASLAIFTILGITDYLDGLMARRDGVTKLGKMLDPIADKIFITVCFIPLVDLEIFPLWLVWPIFLREFLVTELRAVLQKEGMELPVMELGKIKTTIQMIVAGLVLMVATFPGKTVVASLLAGAVTATMFLASVLYYKEGSLSPRFKWALGLLGLGLAVRLLFNDQATILFYGIAMLALTLASGFEYVRRGLPACLQRGARDLARLLLAMAVPMAALILVPHLSRSSTILVILILTVEFISQGLDMWFSRRCSIISYETKVYLIFPAALICAGTAYLLGYGAKPAFLWSTLFLSTFYIVTRTLCLVRSRAG